MCQDIHQSASMSQILHAVKANTKPALSEELEICASVSSNALLASRYKIFPSNHMHSSRSCFFFLSLTQNNILLLSLNAVFQVVAFYR